MSTEIPKQCPECGESVQEFDKDTSSGREIRWYGCLQCDWVGSFDTGIALWKAISIAKKNVDEA